LSFLTPARERVVPIEDCEYESEFASLNSMISGKNENIHLLNTTELSNANSTHPRLLSSVSSVHSSAISETMISSTLSTPISIYQCRSCQTHFTSYDKIISKGFTGRLGRAILVRDVQNIKIGIPCDRMLVTGIHTVADIKCAGCDTNIGWKYLAAFESSQKYKSGKYILELKRVIKKTVSIYEEKKGIDEIRSLFRVDDIQKDEYFLRLENNSMRNINTDGKISFHNDFIWRYNISTLRKMLDNLYMDSNKFSVSNIDDVNSLLRP